MQERQGRRRCYLPFCPDDERVKVLSGLHEVNIDVLPCVAMVPHFDSGEMVD